MRNSWCKSVFLSRNTMGYQVEGPFQSSRFPVVVWSKTFFLFFWLDFAKFKERDWGRILTCSGQFSYKFVAPVVVKTISAVQKLWAKFQYFWWRGTEWSCAFSLEAATGWRDNRSVDRTQRTMACGTVLLLMVTLIFQGGKYSQLCDFSDFIPGKCQLGWKLEQNFLQNLSYMQQSWFQLWPVVSQAHPLQCFEQKPHIRNPYEVFLANIQDVKQQGLGIEIGKIFPGCGLDLAVSFWNCQNFEIWGCRVWNHVQIQNCYEGQIWKLNLNSASSTPVSFCEFLLKTALRCVEGPPNPRNPVEILVTGTSHFFRKSNTK